MPSAAHPYDPRVPADDPGDPEEILISDDGIGGNVLEPLAISDTWRISTESFTTVNLSTKTFTVPATTEWQILSLYITLITTATVGNRLMVVQVLTAADVIIKEYIAAVTQAASLTYRYQLEVGGPQDAALRDTTLLCMYMGPILLTAGQKIKVFDRAAIAAAADDMTVQVQIASRSVV